MIDRSLRVPELGLSSSLLPPLFELEGARLALPPFDVFLKDRTGPPVCLRRNFLQAHLKPVKKGAPCRFGLIVVPCHSAYVCRRFLREQLLAPSPESGVDKPRSLPVFSPGFSSPEVRGDLGGDPKVMI